MRAMLYGLKIDWYFENKKTRSILYQSALFVWTVFNFPVVFIFFNQLSLVLIIMRGLYALLMIWLFATITLNTCHLNKYSIILNPLVIIIGGLLVIIFSPIKLAFLLYSIIKLCILKLISFIKAKLGRQNENAKENQNIPQAGFLDVDQIS